MINKDNKQEGCEIQKGKGCERLGCGDTEQKTVWGETGLGGEADQTDRCWQK